MGQFTAVNEKLYPSLPPSLPPSLLTPLPAWPTRKKGKMLALALFFAFLLLSRRREGGREGGREGVNGCMQ